MQDDLYRYLWASVINNWRILRLQYFSFFFFNVFVEQISNCSGAIVVGRNWLLGRSPTRKYNSYFYMERFFTFQHLLSVPSIFFSKSSGEQAIYINHGIRVSDVNTLHNVDAVSITAYLYVWFLQACTLRVICIIYGVVNIFIMTRYELLCLSRNHGRSHDSRGGVKANDYLL